MSGCFYVPRTPKPTAAKVSTWVPANPAPTKAKAAPPPIMPNALTMEITKCFNDQD